MQVADRADPCFFQIVRRLSLASLNAAIQNKPHLLIDRLSALQPLLYQETIARPELKREVQMGPFKSEYTERDLQS
jgi:cullin-associated NEDD8-dissociated protein 1